MKVEIDEYTSLEITLPDDMDVATFQAVTTRVNKILRVVEREGSVISGVRKYKPRKMGRNGATADVRKLLADKRISRAGLTIPEIAEKLNMSKKNVHDRVYYLKQKGEVTRTKAGKVKLT